MATCVKCCLPGKPIRDSVHKIFTGSCSHRHPLPSVKPNSRLPEGKRVFSIIRSVYTNSLGSEPSLLFLGVVETLPKSKCQLRANLVSRPFEDSHLRTAMLALFLHNWAIISLLDFARYNVTSKGVYPTLMRRQP